MTHFHKIKVLTGHAGPIYAVAQATNTAGIWSAGSDKIVQRWDTELSSSEKISPLSIRTPASVYSLCLIESSNYIAIGLSNGQVYIIDLDEKKEKAVLNYHQKGIHKLVFLRKENKLLVCSADGSFTVWNTTEWKRERTLFIGDQKIRSAAINPDGSLISIGSADKKLRLFETEFLNELARDESHTDGVNCLLFHPEIPVLFSGGKDGHINQYSYQNGLELIQRIPAHNYAIYDLKYSRHHKLMASASRDKSIKLWDDSLTFLEKIDFKTHSGHNRSVNGLTWIANDQYLVSVGDDSQIIIWSKQL